MSSARKRLQNASSSNSNVHFLFRRNPKDALLWKYTDVNSKTTKLVRPQNSGNVLKLGLFIGDAAATGSEFQKRHKLENFCVGNGPNMVEETANTSISGKGLCFSIIFNYNLGATAASVDITKFVNISIHNSGSGYVVGDKFTIDGKRFVKNDHDGDVFGFPAQERNLSVQVLAIN